MPIIAILEDDPRRIATFRDVGCESVFNAEAKVFRSARELISWLKSDPSDLILISLDCDLTVAC